jgi:hypothetical protein
MQRQIIGLTLAALTLTLPASAATPARPVNDFLGSLGVNVHMGYTDGRYANAAEAITDLHYLGIHQLRDGTPNPQGGIPYRNNRDSIAALAKAGNTFLFIVRGTPIAPALAEIASIEEADPGSVSAIEGPNEINNEPISYAGLSGDAAGRAYQRDLYAQVKANKTLGHLSVYYFTGGAKINLGENKGLANYANAHPYPYQGQAPGPRIMSEFNKLFAMPFPRIITETGYFNEPTNPIGSGVDDATQAKLTLDLLLSAFVQGVSKTYLYQLRSAYPDPKHSNADTEYGLFNLDNSPKPVATAIHNLTTILADPAGPAAHAAGNQLSYTLSGMPHSANSVLLRKSPGVFALVVWAEPPIWNEDAHHAVAAPGATVTVNLGAAARSIRVFDPLAGASPSRTYRHTKTVRIEVTDHPVIVEITAPDTGSQD